MVSRARVCTAMLDSSVPTVAKPTVPSTITSPSQGLNSEILKSTVLSSTSSSATTSMKIRLLSILPKNSAARSTGASSRASRLP